MVNHVSDGHAIQLENGNFTQIHNTIMDLLGRARLTGSQLRAVIFLLRKTYGFHKREDAISLSQWAEGTEVDKCQIANTLKVLLAKRVIYRRPGPHASTPVWGFNKYFEQWDASLFVRRSKRESEPLPESPAQVELELNAAALIHSSTEIELQLKKALSYNSTTKERKYTLTKDNYARATAPQNEVFPVGRDPTLGHPAVSVYRDVCHLTPNAVQRQRIAQTVTDVERWRAVLAEWMACGWRPNNVSGMLERYQGNGNSHGGNGYGRPNPRGIVGHNNQNRPATDEDRRPVP